VGLLSRSDVLAGGRNGDHGDIIIVSLNNERKSTLDGELKIAANTYSEELLGSSEGVSNNEGGSEREDDMLVIGVKDKSTVYLAYSNKFS
jgi:hypothetical protein